MQLDSFISLTQYGAVISLDSIRKNLQKIEVIDFYQDSFPLQVTAFRNLEHNFKIEKIYFHNLDFLAAFKINKRNCQFTVYHNESEVLLIGKDTPNHPPMMIYIDFKPNKDTQNKPMLNAYNSICDKHLAETA